MAGKLCPKCNKYTFFKNTTGRKCSNSDCNLEMIVPTNNGKGGKGKKCSNCEKATVFNDKCTSCGAHYK